MVKKKTKNIEVVVNETLKGIILTEKEVPIKIPKCDYKGCKLKARYCFERSEKLITNEKNCCGNPEHLVKLCRFYGGDVFANGLYSYPINAESSKIKEPKDYLKAIINLSKELEQYKK